jgi:FixJ family two-component response regulator
MHAMAPPKLVIAIVDDEEGVRKALRRLFSAADFEAEAFASGQAFLDSLASKRPDCLVLDLHMPGLNGLDMLRHPALSQAHVPTVVITAHDEPESRTQSLAAGAAAYLRKPLDDRTLLAAIASAIGRGEGAAGSSASSENFGD